MGIPSGVTRIVLYGTLPGGEIWQSGYFMPHAAIDPAECNLIAQNAFNRWSDQSAGRTMARLVAKWWHGGVSLVGCKTYAYGDTSGQATFKGSSTGAPVIGSALGSLTNPTSVCITLLTSFAGATQRGRMYLPALGQIPDQTNGYFNGTDVSQLVTSFATDLKNAAVGNANYTPCVVSQKKGAYQTVVSVAADQRPDVQRRRENRQAKGVRSTASLP